MNKQELGKSLKLILERNGLGVKNITCDQMNRCFWGGNCEFMVRDFEDDDYFSPFPFCRYAGEEICGIFYCPIPRDYIEESDKQ